MVETRIPGGREELPLTGSSAREAVLLDEVCDLEMQIGLLLFAQVLDENLHPVDRIGLGDGERLLQFVRKPAFAPETDQHDEHFCPRLLDGLRKDLLNLAEGVIGDLVYQDLEGLSLSRCF